MDNLDEIKQLEKKLAQEQEQKEHEQDQREQEEEREQGGCHRQRRWWCHDYERLILGGGDTTVLRMR